MITLVPEQTIPATMIHLDNLGKKFTLHHKIVSAEEKGQPALTDLWAVRHVSLTIPAGCIVGIVGRNGAGKTTLLNLIAGIMHPTEGSVHINGKVASLFNLGTGFQDTLSGAENIYLNGTLLGMSRQEIDAKFRAIAAFSELGEFLSQPLGTYSQGMRLRLGFSIAMHLSFDVFVIDEVLVVGDGGFQQKCFEAVSQFRRQGKTMVLTTQSLDIIERLSDEVILLDQGGIMKRGDPSAVIVAYRDLLTHPSSLWQLSAGFVTKTKWYAEDRAYWGTREGTKEIEISSIVIKNRWGKPTTHIAPGEPLTVTAEYYVREEVTDAHFGVALFRTDGVYCYGPNTSFDGISLGILTKGSGTFSLSYKAINLMPGTYVFSVVVWDAKEVIAYDYFRGYFTFTIQGENPRKQLMYVPPQPDIRRLFSRHDECLVPAIPTVWKSILTPAAVTITAVTFNDRKGFPQESFCTNEPVTIQISLGADTDSLVSAKVWIGIFRSDQVLCTSTTKHLHGKTTATVHFQTLPLLPGEYRISVGVIDSTNTTFLSCHHGMYLLRMFFMQQDHGTVYLEHRWRIQTP